MKNQENTAPDALGHLTVTREGVVVGATPVATSWLTGGRSPCGLALTELLDVESDLPSQLARLDRGELSWLRTSARLSDPQAVPSGPTDFLVTFHPLPGGNGAVENLHAQLEPQASAHQRDPEDLDTLPVDRAILTGIIEAMAEGMVYHEPSGAIRAVNRAAETILGLSADQIRGRSSTDPDWQSFHPDGTPFSGDTHPAMICLRTGQPVRDRLMGIRQGEQSPRWIRINAHPVHHADGSMGVVATFRDVTAYQSAQEKLAEQEALYRDLVENHPMMIERYRPDTTILFANRTLADFFGTTPEALQGARWMEMLPPEEQEAARSHLATYTTEEPVHTFENTVPGPNGELRWTHWTNRAFFDETGQIAWFQSVGIDITERRRAELERDRLTAILEASPDFIAMADTQGNPLYHNPAALDLIGEHRLMNADGIADFHPPEARQVLLDEALPTAREQGYWLGETTVIDQNGHHCPMSQLVVAHRGPEGEVQRYSTVMRDLSEQKAHETSLQQLTEILESTPDFVGMADADGNPLYVNSGGWRMVGLDAPETSDGFNLPEEARHETAGLWLHPEWAQQVLLQEGFPRAVQDGIWRGETAMVDVHGREIPTSQVIIAHRDSDGQLIRLSTILRDISEQRRLTEELQRSNAELEQFAYAISHDLQEPLRILTSYLGLLQTRYSEALDDKAGHYISTATEAGGRMQRMIQDLLDYSRIRRLGDAFRPVDLDAVLAEALANLEEARTESGAEITLDSLPVVAGDHGQLVRLFQNLLSNALKYRHPQETPRITMDCHPEGEEYHLRVSDNGLGIDPGQLEKIFNVFQRLHTRDEYPGTGAGLALARRIVERHGGRIRAESPGEGHGTTFHLTLPAAAEEATVSEQDGE